MVQRIATVNEVINHFKLFIYKGVLQGMGGVLLRNLNLIWYLQKHLGPKLKESKNIVLELKTKCCKSQTRGEKEQFFYKSL